MTDEEEIAGALVQPSKLARHNGNISEGPCGNSCGRLTLKERLTGAVLCTGHCRLYVKYLRCAEGSGLLFGQHYSWCYSPRAHFCKKLVLCHSPVRKDFDVLCIFYSNSFICGAYSNGLLCTSDLLEIDLQERSPETEREKRRALLRGGTRAQMANLVPRDQKREKLARSELKWSVLHCK